MKTFICFVTTTMLLIACNNTTQKETSTTSKLPIQGTWKLISGTTIDKDTVITDYTKGKSFIKVINDTHFAFLGHDLDKGKDSASAYFSSGGGRYELNDSSYKEHLEYCSDRQWEGNDFPLTINIKNDTLVLQGVEKVDSIDVNRINIEKYVRIKE